jgi:6-pyruvoyltetrahydropterin/6-carboxytetrahydropterin synthase
MFEVEITRNFSAAHCLRNYQGNCAKLHGHNWIVKVSAKSGKLDEIGIAVDFRKLKENLDEILTSLDHNNLNDLPLFSDRNPTSENVAEFIFGRMSEKLNSRSVKISKVTVSESPDSSASYYD